MGFKRQSPFLFPSVMFVIAATVLIHIGTNITVLVGVIALAIGAVLCILDFVDRFNA